MQSSHRVLYLFAYILALPGGVVKQHFHSGEPIDACFFQLVLDSLGEDHDQKPKTKRTIFSRLGPS